MSAKGRNNRLDEHPMNPLEPQEPCALVQLLLVALIVAGFVAVFVGAASDLP